MSRITLASLQGQASQGPARQFSANPKSNSELEALCIAAGVPFCGCFHGFFKLSGEFVEPLCVFQGTSGTALALPVSTISVEAIRLHVAESDSRFESSS